MAKKRRRKPSKPTEEELQGPPPMEATIMHSNAERQVEEELAEYTETSPRLTAGDVDADWERAASDGEEAAGGSVSTPDQDVVDEIGDALGVSRSPDEPFQSSEEILEKRDRHRAQQEDTSEP